MSGKPIYCTPRQVAFLQSLRTERVHSLDLSDAAIRGMTTPQASAVIGQLLKAPRVTAAAVSASLVTSGSTPASAPAPLPTYEEQQRALWEKRDGLLAEVGKGHFALPGDARPLEFFQVRKAYGRDRLEIARLSGAPGGFNRYRMPVVDQILWLERIASDPFDAMFRFAEHYRVCGRCAAELTDERSRQRRFGSDCWGFLSDDAKKRALA